MSEFTSSTISMLGQRVKVPPSVFLTFPYFDVGSVDENEKYVFGRVVRFLNNQKQHCIVTWDKYPIRPTYIPTKQLLHELYHDEEDICNIPIEVFTQPFCAISADSATATSISGVLGSESSLCGNAHGFHFQHSGK